MYREQDERNDDRELQRAVKSFLQEGEEILWMGQPYKSVEYRPFFPVLLFSLFWLGFAIFWTVTASAGGGFFGLFGIPFILIGVYILYSTLFGAKKTYQSTVYAVTPQRAIIVVTKGRGAQFRDFRFATMSSVQIVCTEGPCGTIDFIPELAYNGYYNQYDYNGRRYYHSSNHIRFGGRSYPTAGSTTFSAFEMIDNVQEVYQLITDCIAKYQQPQNT